MEEYQDRQIEQFFHKKYAQPIAPEDWNTPDDAIWEHIEAHLPRNKRRRGCWFWIFNGLLVSVSMSLIGFAAFSTTILSPTAEGKASVEQTSPSIEPVRPPAAVLTYGTEQPASSQSAPNHSEMGLQPTSSFNNTNAYALVARQGLFLPQNSIENTANQLYLPEQNHLIALPQADNAHQRVSLLPLPVLIEPLQTPKSSREPIPLVVNTAPSHPSTDMASPKWKGDITIWHQQWQQIRRGQLNAPLSELLKEETLLPSWSIGGNIQRRFTPSWSIRVGLAWIRQQHVSKYLLHVPYTLSTEQPATDGGVDNHFAHTLPSETGAVHTNLVLRRDAQALVHDHEIVDINFSFQRRINWLNFPTQIMWEPQRLRGLYVMSGPSMALRLTDHLLITEAQSLHADIRGKSIGVTPTSKAPRWMGQWSCGAGYRRSLTDHWQFQLEVQYLRSLSPLYQQNGFSYHSHLFQAGAGISRSF